MTKELATTATKQKYVILEDGVDIGEVIVDNLGGEAISSFDLDKITVPAGGSTTWEVSTLDGIKEAKDIEGIIIASKSVRVFWKDAYTGASNPPDCSSNDGMTGIGEPGGDCLKCPNSSFGSSVNGRSQGCKLRRSIFLLMPDSILPTVISVPPSSLKEAKKYLLRLAGQRKPVYSVITRLSLEKDKNADGIVYSKVVFHALGDCPDIGKMKAYSDAIKPFIAVAANIE